MDLEGMEKLIKFGHEQNKEGIRELKESNEKAHKEMNDYNKGQFKEVIERQDYTNGDVRSLKIWRGWQKGVYSVLSFFTIFALVMLINTIDKQNTKLEKQSTQIKALSEEVRIDNTSLLNEQEYRIEELERFTNIKNN